MIHWLIRILGWLFGVRFAADNEVIPVLRLGRFRRVGGPGFFQINPFLEQTLPAISTGIRREELTFNEVVSRDNIPFTFRLTTRFMFDPNQALSEIVAQLVRAAREGLRLDKTSDKESSKILNEELGKALDKELRTTSSKTSGEKTLDEKFGEILRIIVRDYAGEALYRLASRFKAEELRSDPTRNRIQYNLTHYLKGCFQGLGLIPLADGGILIQEIVADKKFKETMLNAEQHEAILRALDVYKYELNFIDKAIRSEFLNSLEDHQERLTLVSDLTPEHLPYLYRWQDVLQPPEQVKPSPKPSQAGSNGSVTSEDFILEWFIEGF